MERILQIGAQISQKQNKTKQETTNHNSTARKVCSFSQEIGNYITYRAISDKEIAEDTPRNDRALQNTVIESIVRLLCEAHGSTLLDTTAGRILPEG